jgi:hypothetical protein
MDIAKVLEVNPGQLLTPDSVIVNIHDNKIDAGAIFYTGEQILHMESKELVEVLREQLILKDEIIKTLTDLLKQKE